MVFSTQNVHFSVSLLLVLLFGVSNESYGEDLNPCSQFPCAKDSLCWNDGGTAKCENACNSTYCGEDHHCVNEVGPCGNSSCRPTGRCHSLTNATELCQNVNCSNEHNCTVVKVIVPTGFVPMAICEPNPCLGHECCAKSSEEVCTTDACYLKRAPGSPIDNVQLEPWCVNPCLLHDLPCETPGEFCYKNKVECFAPPCNPVPVCRKPCDGDAEKICGRGLKCEVIKPTCEEEEDPLSNYWNVCQPIEHCVAESQVKDKIKLIIV